MDVNFTRFMKSNENGVYYIGHASALARLEGNLVLFDPVWNHRPYGEYWEFLPEQINCDSILDQVDFVVISHIHADHVCERILRKIKCPVHIMSGRPNLTEKLLSFGCHVVEIDPYEWHRGFYFVPHAFNSIDSSCFVKFEQYCVYCGSDNFLSREVLQRIINYIPRVDVAMVPYAFIHWYPHLLTMDPQEKAAEVERLNQQSLDQAEMFDSLILPVVTIPFGNSLFHVENDELNKKLAQPEDFKSAVAMHAGSYVLGDDIYVTKKERELPDVSDVMDRLSRATFGVEGHQLIIACDHHRFKDLVIDLENHSFWLGSPTPHKNYTRFILKPIIYNQWLNGEITFEEAIGTRQFWCERVPNVYNQKVFEFMNLFL